MAEAEVVRAVRRFRLMLGQRDEALLELMARRWLELERALVEQIELLAREAAERAARGEAVSADMIRRWGRYERLIEQTREQATRYVRWADEVIAAEQRALVGLGLEHAGAALRAFGPSVIGAFDVLPVGAFENMVGLASDGSPLRDYLLRMYPQAAQGMLDALIRGVGLGWNPTKTARAMREGLGVGLQTSLRTARTETLRAYREATLAQYRQAPVIEGYRRLASKSSRTCIACIALDGEWFPLTTPFEEHVQGRCTPVPSLKPDEKIVNWQPAQEWFGTLSPGMQREMMGKGLYEAWKGGQISLRDAAVLHQDPTWGGSWQVASVKQAVSNQQRSAVGG